MAGFLVEFRLHGFARDYAEGLILDVAKKFSVKGVTRKRPVPHITLYGPGDTRDMKRVISTVERVAKAYTLVPFKIRGFDCFDNAKNKVVYLDITASPELQRLRHELSKELQKVSTCRPFDKHTDFAFHSTIAFKDIDRKFDDIWNYIKQNETPNLNQHLLRITILSSKGRIVCEYDLVLKRMLSRKEALDRKVWGETIRRLKQISDSKHGIETVTATSQKPNMGQHLHSYSQYKYSRRYLFWRKFNRVRRATQRRIRQIRRSRWFLVILGLLIAFLSIAYWPTLLDKWPWGAESFIKWLEIPVEVFGGFLVLIGLFAGRYRTRIKAIRVALILLAIVTVATYAYYDLDDSGKIDEWLDRSSDEDTLSGMIKEKIPTMADTIGELRTVAEDKIGDVGDIVSDAFEDDRVWVDGAYLVGAKGNAIKLDNNSKAQNPSWSQLIEFLKRDDTDKQRYSYNSFVCADFAEMLHNNAEDAGWRCAYVCVDLSIGGHALNAFETTDKGLLYIDCTNSISPSPGSADKTVDVKVGKAYIPISIFSETGWNSTWDSMGTVTQIEKVKW